MTDDISREIDEKVEAYVSRERRKPTYLYIGTENIKQLHAETGSNLQCTKENGSELHYLGMKVLVPVGVPRFVGVEGNKPDEEYIQRMLRFVPDMDVIGELMAAWEFEGYLAEP